jgi:hypothetical protein
MKYLHTNSRKIIFRTVLFPVATVLLLAKTVVAETLTTHNFRVDITRNCPEGYVTCNDVKYHGVNRKTGETIVLKGKSLHAPGRDGTTPGRFLGYEFLNRNYRYVVAIDGDRGRLMVYQGKKLLLNESGTIQY